MNSLLDEIRSSLEYEQSLDDVTPYAVHVQYLLTHIDKLEGALKTIAGMPRIFSDHPECHFGDDLQRQAKEALAAIEKELK